MDRQEQSALLKKMPFPDEAPSYLWIGNPEQLIKHIKTLFQQKYCISRQGCTLCIPCTQIEQEHHHALMWLAPEKNYTIDQLSVIFDTIALRLDEHEHFFFIIQKADFLPALCANRLLKPLEEPPPGYHFILLAQRIETVIPTIRSRCIIRTFASSKIAAPYEQLLSCFTKPTDPFAFMEILEASKINERESVELLDELIAFWLEQVKTALLEENSHLQSRAQAVLRLLKHAVTQPPMPGSSKLFWKDLFLQMNY